MVAAVLDENELSIGQRNQRVRNASRILVIENGHIAERGTTPRP